MVTDFLKSTARSLRESTLFLLEVAKASPRSSSGPTDGDDSVELASLERHSLNVTGINPWVDGMVLLMAGFSYVFLSHRGDLGEDAWAFLGCSSPDDVEGTGSILSISSNDWLRQFRCKSWLITGVKACVGWLI